MKKIHMDFIFPAAALLLLVLALSHQFFKVPPLGKVLDPFVGAIQNENDALLDSKEMVVDDAGLNGHVDIYFDGRRVPHIFAENTHDLYFAQGYVTASLRLWQMDFLSYVSAGRLSEIFSEGFLDYDRNQRRIGILAAARSSLKMIEKDTATMRVIDAYTEGVNAYIKQLDYREFPFEYKILDYKPEPWNNLKTVLVMKYMAAMLSGYEEDNLMTNLMLALGEQRFNMLYPGFGSHISPMAADSAGRLNSALSFTKKPDYLDYSFLSSATVIGQNSYDPRLGSNSWAVSGKKTRSGFPILCSDPHLGLSLPSIWVEMQLSAPGVCVYGVSIPGAPSIIIGFNKDVAWGTTNGEGDSKDWYKLKISADYKTYLFNSQWIPLSFEVEEIKRRNQQPLYDTIYHTVQGPIVSDKNFPGPRPELANHALRWQLHQPSNELLSFIRLNSSRNYDDYKEAISHYGSPVQNFVFACRDNCISADYRGSIAVKWPGQGRFILDGTRKDHLYGAYIPVDSLPHSLNPVSNFVVSANQHPSTPRYPYYYNGYYNEYRATRISQLLEKENDFDHLKMQAIQTDNVSLFSADAVRVLLNYVANGSLTAEERACSGILAGWDGSYAYDSEAAGLFDLFWKNVKDYTWDEFRNFSFKPNQPDDYVLLEMIRTDPGNKYFDNGSTSNEEAAGDIILQAFKKACLEYATVRKEGKTKWHDFNKVNILHMTNIPILSRLDIPSAGTGRAINANSGNIGPSWRMIVELGETPKAWGIYAGGQSGNVAGKYFDSFIQDWNHGTYYPLEFFQSKTAARSRATASWSLK